MRIEGRVQSGHCVGNRLTQLPWFVQAVREVARFEPFPGTLNLLLSEPGETEALLLTEATTLVPPSPDYCCAELRRVAVRRAEADEASPGMIVRPRVRGYSLTQLELVSPVNLRERLHLVDGDVVIVEPLGAPGPTWLQGREKAPVAGVAHGEARGTAHLGSGEVAFDAQWTATANGVTVTLVGGLPHLGAVALATPRPSLRDPSRPSSTSSVLTLPGHKDDVVARMVAERLASQLDQNVSVAAGIHAGPAGHYDLSEADLRAIMAQVEAIVQDLQTQISSAQHSQRSR